MACNLFPAAAAQGKPAVKGKEKELQCWRKLNIYSQVALPDILSNKDKNKHKGSHKFQSKVGKQDVRKTPWSKAEKDAVFCLTKLRKV